VGELGQPQQKTPPAVPLRTGGFHVKPQAADHMARSIPGGGIAAKSPSTDCEEKMWKLQNPEL